MFGRTYAEVKRKKQAAIANLFVEPHAPQALRTSKAKALRVVKAIKISKASEELLQIASTQSEASSVSSVPLLKGIALQWLEGLKTTRKKSTV